MGKPSLKIQYENRRDFENSTVKVIETFENQYRDVFIMKEGITYVDAKLWSEIEKLTFEIMGAWIHSSGELLRVIGQEKVFSIFGVISNYRQELWDYDEYKAFISLPEKIKIYRGGVGGMNEILKGFSWTASLEVAKGYSACHTDGSVLSAEICKNDVLLINIMERELVPHPSKLKNIELVPFDYIDCTI